MKITVDLDDELMRLAHKLTKIRDEKAIVQKAVQELVAYEAGMKLAAMGGSQPDFTLEAVKPKKKKKKK